MLSRGLGLAISLVLATGLLVGVFSAPAQAEPAPNEYGYEFAGTCAPTGFTPVNALFTNVADSEGQPASISVISESAANGGWVPGASADDVVDGEPTKHLALNADAGGLVPGTWNLLFYLNRDWSAPVATVRLFVPGPCGPYDVPETDPSQLPPDGTGDGGHDHAVKPRGSVHLANCQTGLIKGYVSTKGVLPKGKKTKFLTKVGQRKPVKFKRLNGVKKRKRLVFKHVPKRALVVLKYKRGHKWILLSKDGNVGCGGSR
jgi:hypothetical protein